MGLYRRYEAQTMLDTLTRDLPSKKDKIIKVILNFRNDIIFTQSAFTFFVKEYFGE